MPRHLPAGDVTCGAGVLGTWVPLMASTAAWSKVKGSNTCRTAGQSSSAAGERRRFIRCQASAISS